MVIESFNIRLFSFPLKPREVKSREKTPTPRGMTDPKHMTPSIVSVSEQRRKNDFLELTSSSVSQPGILHSLLTDH